MQKPYILLTAAKNEEAHIGDAIESVLRQSALPLAWFIMDDGSSDRTAAIVEDFAARHRFIYLHSAGSGEGRNFGSQYRALQAAYRLAEGLSFDFVGMQDADVAIERADYYEAMLEAFERRPQLGIVGGFIYERANGIWQCRRGNSEDSVAGGIQMFRRRCFEQIGGYTALSLGGSDWLAQLDARVAGWEVLARPEYRALHYRPSSSAGGRWRGHFRAGLMDGSFGSHPAFEAFKCCRRLTSSPVLVGGLLRWGGYCWWRLRGREPLIGEQRARYLRTEQMAKLRRWLVGAFRGRGAAGTGLIGGPLQPLAKEAADHAAAKPATKSN